jgi:hypothetical protein
MIRAAAGRIGRGWPRISVDCSMFVTLSKHQHWSKVSILPVNSAAFWTAAGHSVLEEELKHRIQVERPRLIQRIQDAIADDSNLAGNSE